MFETIYPNQFIMEREELPPHPVSTTYKVFQDKPENIHSSNRRDDKRVTNMFWTNDADDSLYKIGYLDKWPNLKCNIVPNSTTPFQYTSYNCMSYIKQVYTFDLDAPLGDSTQLVDFTVHTPEYNAIPYEYIHYVTILGRRMNSFHMCFSSELIRTLESSMKQWTKAIARSTEFEMERVNYTQLAMPGLTDCVRNSRIHLVKLQMAIKPIYYYWVVETLIRNAHSLYEAGICSFKLLYMMGDLKRMAFGEVFPDLEVGKDVMTYHMGNTEYKRELLIAPNIVFYLTKDANVKGVVDILCGLFPDNLELTMGVPRFNMRLNNNVYISFEGNNEDKYSLQNRYVPPEYRRILQSKNPKYINISQRFSGHTIMNPDGSENNIQSYQKLIQTGTFKDFYTQYGLDEYYHTVFPDEIDGGKRTKRRRNRRRTRVLKK